MLGKLHAMMTFSLVVFATTGFIASATPASATEASEAPHESEGAIPEPTCSPTSPDSLGPFYEPDAPIRSSVGMGYVLSGVVRCSRDCSVIPGAHVEFWLAGPNGRYDGAHRATIIADQSGRYRFESNFPPGYAGRPPHIHIRVSAPGYKTLVTQHYPSEGEDKGTFDLVLRPAS